MCFTKNGRPASAYKLELTHKLVITYEQKKEKEKDQTQGP
jgi:hypothetical protein